MATSDPMATSNPPQTSQSTNDPNDETPTHLSSIPDPGPHINGHLVATGIWSDGKRKMYVHASGKSTMNHACISYYPCRNAAVVRRNGDDRSPSTCEQEHGWVRNVHVLNQICTGTGVTIKPTQAQTFDHWRGEVLDQLRNNPGFTDYLSLLSWTGWEAVDGDYRLYFMTHERSAVNGNWNMCVGRDRNNPRIFKLDRMAKQAKL
ncbi:uncharacterized protein BDZ99DRAFT_566541 [Mytilinidion resinicola]|uniref:Uncharacterized protein n=1 Tax=Mytilinidion resinicola TaxID=574789 RepID=A0A6A6Z2U7_9PEZI|nr:uncharacterized protein BDZ99DRAFT_566541 [Mytilinidion resinicola]KAF2814557.1 hypothetical protein BDZ99DRAFT_566541 [Mytilinidion resinicola]